MLIQVLVREQIEGGSAVLDVLNAEGFPVSGAFWCRIPDQDYWQLIIASVFVSQMGPLAAYQRVRAILSKRPVETVSISDISIFSLTDPEYLRLREYALGPDQFGGGPGNGFPRNTSFADGWAYV